MKVKKLIELLKTLPQEADVVVAGYAGGVQDIKEATVCEVNCNVYNELYYGAHEVIDAYTTRTDNTKPAVLIS